MSNTNTPHTSSKTATQAATEEVTVQDTAGSTAHYSKQVSGQETFDCGDLVATNARMQCLRR